MQHVTKTTKGSSMNTKKILASALIISFLGLETMPVLAIEKEKTKVKLSRKAKKAQAQRESRLDYINIDWWQGFNDQYLNEYILKAFDNNHDLKIATLKVEEARQGVKAQLASELPSLYVGAAPGIAKLPMSTSTTGNFIIPIVASYEIDIFLKNHDKTKSMRKLYEASQLKEKATYLAIVSAVGSTYYNIVKVDKLIELQDKIVNDRKQIYELMKLRNEQGITSTSDLVQAEKAYVLADSDLTELERVRNSLLTSLSVLIGDSPENISEYKRISYDELTKKSIPNEIPTEIITSRPDYLAAEKMVEKTGLDVRVAKKEFLPSFNIGGLLTFMATSQINAMNWETALAGAGILGLLPIFTGGKRIANVKIQKSRYEQALQTYHKTNVEAIKEVNDALYDLKMNTVKYEKDMTALSNEQKDYKLAQEKYKEGIISKLDLMQKNEVLLSTQKLAVSEDINTYINQISLYKATAGAKL